MDIMGKARQYVKEPEFWIIMLVAIVAAFIVLWIIRKIMKTEFMKGLIGSEEDDKSTTTTRTSSYARGRQAYMPNPGVPARKPISDRDANRSGYARIRQPSALLSDALRQ